VYKTQEVQRLQVQDLTNEHALAAFLANIQQVMCKDTNDMPL